MARNGTLLEGCHTGEAGMVRVALSRGEDPNPVVLGLWQVAEQRINDATFGQGFTCSFFSLPDLITGFALSASEHSVGKIKFK